MVGKCMTKTDMVLSQEPFCDSLSYRSTIGALQHICVTLPYIHFIVNRLCQYMQNSHLVHWKVVLRILRHLKGTVNHGLLFKTNTSVMTNVATLVSYLDVD